MSGWDADDRGSATARRRAAAPAAAAWDAEAAEELLRALPEPRRLLRQVVLSGSAIVAPGQAAELPVTAAVPAAWPPAATVLVAGARADEVAPAAVLLPGD